jgi:radical SAM-linked protein
MRARFTNAPPVMLQRVRLRFSRQGAGAEKSHLQQIDVIRRALREAGWPVSESQAKRPVMKISFGPAVSVGLESLAEYCDVQLSARMDFKKAQDDLSAKLPAGYHVMEIKSIPRFFPSLEESINLSHVTVESDLLAGSEPRWADFEKAVSFPVVKKKGDRDVVIDARPLVKSWALKGNVFEVYLRFGPGRTIKPERLVQAVCGLPEDACAVGTPACQVRVTRKNFYFEKDNGDLHPV